MGEISHKEKVELLIDNLIKFKDSEVWYKYTENRFFSKMEKGYYYVLRRGKLLFHEMHEDNQVRRFDVLGLVENLIKECKIKEEKEELEEIFADFNYILSIVIKSGDEKPPLIDDIIKVDVIDRLGRVKFYMRDDSVVEFETNDIEELEDSIEDCVDELAKVEIEGKVWYRHDLLSEKFKEIEKQILLTEENYETLGWYKKLEDETKK